MTRRDKLKKEYFEWLLSVVDSSPFTEQESYNELLQYLFDMDFRWSLGNDVNRADDGIQLRERFEALSEWSDVPQMLSDKPCSVLEMMSALAIRCEEHIMGDSEIGDRTSKWFWSMIINLDLVSMRDGRFTESYVLRKINRFLDRKYTRNGEGGLFIIENPKYDMRRTEIYYQMCYCLNEMLEGE